MTKNNFPYIAAAIGVLLAIIITKGSESVEAGRMILPLLTLLIICEFGGIITAIGLYLGGRQILSQGFDLLHSLVTISCLILSVYFLTQGIQFWPL